MEGLESKERKEILRRIVSPEGRERLARVRLVKPELVSEIEEYLIKLYINGRIKKMLSEEEIVKLLKLLSSKG
ncbi:MAG: DNA-binding protein [Candidatus Aenigmarchaeota archaeon]|nr:DNA-binding protein [Candidatus Aenigmarchaeota archaeon]